MEDKKKLIIASLILFICEIVEIFIGYLNGAAVEAITELDFKNTFIDIEEKLNQN